MGVAWRVVSDEHLIREAQLVAAKLAALPPLSVRAMKRVLNHSAASNIDSAIRNETEATVAGFLDPETTERLKRF